MNHINKRSNLKLFQRLSSSKLKLLFNSSISTLSQDLLSNSVNLKTQNVQYFSKISNDKEGTLQSYLKSKIRMKGPITVSEFMKEALSNPYHVSKITRKIKINKICFKNFILTGIGILYET
jgi:hypothetical protein